MGWAVAQRGRTNPASQDRLTGPRRNGAVVPRVFRPPSGGGGYYGQAYHWEQVLHYKFWSFVAINAWIREVAGGAPPMIGRLKPKQPNGRKAVKKALGGPRSHQEFESYDDEHPLVRVFSNPNLSDVGYDLWAYHILFKKLTGQAHWWVMRNDFGVPVELWVIPTHWMRLVTDAEGQPSHYFVNSPWGGAFEIQYDEVVSFYEHSPLNPRYEGSAVSLAINEWIDSYESLVRMRMATFKNSAVPSMHVALGESYGDPDEQMLARYYAKFFARFQGENRSDLPMLTGPDVTVTPIQGHRPADALRESNESEIHIGAQTLAAYGVPKAVVGLIDNLTFGAIEAGKDAFREYSVNAELTYTGQVLTEKIVKMTPHCEDGVLYWEDRRTGDPEYKLREMEFRKRSGALSPNEIRTNFGDEPWPNGGDDPFFEEVEMPWHTGHDRGDPLVNGPGPGSLGLGTDAEVPQPEEPVPLDAEPVRVSLNESTGANGGFVANGERVEKALKRLERKVARRREPKPQPITLNLTMPAGHQTINLPVQSTSNRFDVNVPQAPVTPVVVKNHLRVPPANPTPVAIYNKNDVSVNPTPVDVAAPVVEVHVSPTPVTVVNESVVNVDPTPVEIRNEINVPEPKAKHVRLSEDVNGEITGTVE